MHKVYHDRPTLTQGHLAFGAAIAVAFTSDFLRQCAAPTHFTIASDGFNRTNGNGLAGTQSRCFPDRLSTA
ncbi:MAG: hypothetical protein CBB71_05840 [Rhodopirellula sp. TMED11]|nr:MAG: hypothetical protein CBB71_05840 [Rhodopirellula sp. TMED11]